MVGMDALLPAGLAERLSTSPEPSARWVALTGLEHRPTDDPAVVEAHAQVLADPTTQDLLDRLHPWDEWHPIGGHDKPTYLPNLLGLLADRGVGAADVPAIEQLHRSMLGHQDDAGRFLYLGRAPGGSELAWSSLPCDYHAITEVLLRAGHCHDPAVQRAVALIASHLTPTSQGPGWKCLPDPVARFRGPGRKDDACPQVTVEALRVFSYLPADQRPPSLRQALHTTLGFWRRRGQERPYMFGHGVQFKRGKWPAVWYSAYEVVDVVGRYPQVWAGPDADPADRRALTEIASCLLAYSFDAAGELTPRSVYRGFEGHSFGQKKRPSDLAAALVAVALSRLAPLAEDVHAVDVGRLASSVGGTGSPVAP